MGIDLRRIYDAYDELVAAASLHGTQTMTEPAEILIVSLETCRKALEAQITGRSDYYEALLKLRLVEVLREYRSIGQICLSLGGTVHGSTDELQLISTEADRLGLEIQRYLATLQHDIQRNPFLAGAIALLADDDRTKLNRRIRRIVTDEERRSCLLGHVDQTFEHLLK